jgi:flagellin-like protein
MKKRGGKNESKRGLSPVIASVLLILLVIVLASFIFLWARGFISEQIEKFGQPVEKLCDSISFEAEIVDSGAAGADSLKVINTGNTAIFQLDLRMTKEGNSVVSTFKFKIDPGASTRGDVYLKMKDGTRPDELEVFPAIIGSVKGKNTQKVFTCINNGKVIDLKDLVGEE